MKNAALNFHNMILNHSWSAPAFSCSSVTWISWPSSFFHMDFQSRFPCSSMSNVSSALKGGRIPGIPGGGGSRWGGNGGSKL